MQHTNSAAQALATVISGHRSSPLRFVRLTEVMRMTGLRKTTIYKLQADGEFPQRVQITTHCVGWIECEVQAWLNQRAATRETAVLFKDRATAPRYTRSALS